MEQVRSVTVIPARKKKMSEEQDAAPKVKVAAYCRVSTDSDEQATSYEAQVDHYTSYIKANPEWEFAGIYADDGITGTNTKKRDDFNRMIDDCMAGKIDMVVTKSISRFARNTLDCLKYIRQLKERDIPVYFEKEAINTLDAKGEVLLTIMASLAQQESQSMSQNIRLGIQYRFQKGKMQVNYSKFLGYAKGEDGQPVIVPEEAAIVKRIFREYLEGASLREICEGLERDGVLTGAHLPCWRPETVYKMLQNEKYMGDALLQKTYTVDYLTKKKVKNEGIAPQYYVENSHEPIIPKDIFMRTQEELRRRANLNSGTDRKKRVYSSKYALNGCKSTVWRCVSRVHKKTSGIVCPARTIHEETLHDVVLDAMNQITVLDESFFAAYRTSLETALEANANIKIRAVEEKLTEKQKELIKLQTDDENYCRIADEIYALREEKQKLLSTNAENSIKMKKVDDIMNYIKAQNGKVERYDESLVRKFIQSILVHDDHFTVVFKSGTEIEVAG